MQVARRSGLVILLDHVQHDEQAIAVLVDLGSLMTFLRILHGEGVQLELILHLRDLRGLRVAQSHPDEDAGLAEILMNVADVEVGELRTVPISHTRDQHEMSPPMEEV